MSASWKERAEVAAIVLAFPVLITLGILLRELSKDKAVRKRLARLDEDELGCYTEEDE